MTWLANWMEKLPPERKLIDIMIPGSHDAGVWGSQVTKANMKLMSNPSWAVCQNSNFYNQAVSGSRFFDCRVFLRKKKPGLSLEERLRLAHFAPPLEKKGNKGKTGTGGSYGGTLQVCLSDAIFFVKTHPKECLILRFSHTGAPDEVEAAVRQWTADNGWDRYIFQDQGGYNIAFQPMQVLGGKIVMVFDEDSHGAPAPGDGIHLFQRWDEKKGAITRGLSCCGKYASSDKMSKVVKDSLRASEKHATHARDHLHFVYWQQTMSFESIEEATVNTSNKTKGGPSGDGTFTGGAHANLGRYLEMLTTAVKNTDASLTAPLGTVPGFTSDVRLATAFTRELRFRYPNVISHDFVCDETCKKIVKMNPEVDWPA